MKLNGESQLWKRGNRSNTFSHFVNHRFAFICDPYDFKNNQLTGFGLPSIVSDLALRAEPPLQIYLVYPSYLGKISHIPFKGIFGDCFIDLSRAPSGFQLAPSQKISKSVLDKLSQGDEQSTRLVSLLALAEGLQADGLVTTNKILLEAKDEFYQYHRIRIFTPEEFAGGLETLAHGNGIFWSAKHLERKLTLDVFYQSAHPKNKALIQWFNSVPTRNPLSEKVSKSLRSLIINRYPFLLYARDMVCFYQFQRDYFSRRGLMQRFGMAIGYHLASFYFLLWGTLDHLANLTTEVLNLGVAERSRGIRNREFLEELKKRQRPLWDFLKSNAIDQWVEQMADVRHQASHDEIPIPSPFLKDTPESLKSDDEVLKELRKESPLFYEIMPPGFMEEWEKEMIPIWRLHKMEVLAESVVLIERKDGTRYMREPVISIDFDLAKVTEVIDTFLDALFHNSSVLSKAKISP